ncbi:voltage gated chloride channel family domain protein [Burkholderia pseudomallei NCTC 13179]|nr:voltage gated chloride channel family domain protein [Burkholderia pseudomallei NCTC 13179]
MPNPIACASPVSPIRSAPAAARGPLARIAAVTLLTGAGAGLGGMLLALLLHAIQHLATGTTSRARSAMRAFSKA